MAALPAAVNVITTAGPAGRHGMTATAVCSVSDDPASCWSASTRARECMMSCAPMAGSASMLAAGQDGVSGAFATRALSIEERLERAGGVVAMDDGQPALAQAQVALACRIAQVMEVGTHSIFIGGVEQVVPGQGLGALAYYEKSYHHLGQVAA
jgi:flavin reductase